ncbi:MAG: hypothetical protein ACREMY_07160, partial [bacterium]
MQNMSFQGDNWQAGCPSITGADCTIPANNFGLPDSQGMPLVPSAIQYTDSNHIVWEGTSRYHIQGWAGPEFNTTVAGASSNILIENGIAYDIGAGGIRIGRQAAVTDTNANVPSFVTVQNEYVSFANQLQMTGEATGGVYFGDSHDVTVMRNTIDGTLVGGINCGHGLNRGQSGGDFAFFQYNNSVLMNRITGRNNGGNMVSLMHDFGGIYCASNLSINAPTLAKPTLVPNTFSTHITWNVVSLQDSDWTYNVDGANCIYEDQGSSNVEVRFNLLFGCAHHAFFLNLSSHGNKGNVGAELLEQWNYVQNNIVAGCGARQYASTKACINAGGDTRNQHHFEMEGNIFLINSNNGQQIQSNPSDWAAFDFSEVTVTAPGAGYTSEPTVTVPSCTGAVLKPAISYQSGTLLGMIIDTPGSLCPVNPAVNIVGGGGAGATVTACTSGGALVPCTAPALVATRMFDFGNEQGNQYWDLASLTIPFVLCHSLASCP